VSSLALRMMAYIIGGVGLHDILLIGASFLSLKGDKLRFLIVCCVFCYGHGG
jgi:hypothetical protein